MTHGLLVVTPRGAAPGENNLAAPFKHTLLIRLSKPLLDFYPTEMKMCSIKKSINVHKGIAKMEGSPKVHQGVNGWACGGLSMPRGINQRHEGRRMVTPKTRGTSKTPCEGRKPDTET